MFDRKKWSFHSARGISFVGTIAIEKVDCGGNLSSDNDAEYILISSQLPTGLQSLLCITNHKRISTH